MKTLRFLSLILMVSLAVVSCKKDDDGGEDPTGGEGTLTAKVDGQTVNTTLGITAVENSGTLAISGGTMESENLQIIITSFNGVGTYPLNFTNIGTYSYLPDPSNPDPNTVVVYATVNGLQNTGEINITSYSNSNVKGTFSFTGYNYQDTSDTVSVTEGQFNINF